MKWQHESAESAARLERPPHVRSSDCQWRNLAVQLQHVATPSLFVRFNLVVRILIRDICPNFLHQLQYLITSCSQQPHQHLEENNMKYNYCQIKFKILFVQWSLHFCFRIQLNLSLTRNGSLQNALSANWP